MNKHEEMRSKFFFYVGNALVTVIVLMFIGVFGFTFSQMNFWQHFVFGDLHSLENACQYRILSSDGQATPFAPVKIPHYGVDLMHSVKDRTTSRLQYQCEITPRQETMATAHMGWIMGDRIDVRTNGGPLYSLQGPEKLALNFQGPTKILIEVSSTESRQWIIGFSANQPAVVAYSYKEASLVGGIEVLLGIARGLNHILPIFSLVAVICISWMTGFKSRVFLIAIYSLLWIVSVRTMSIVGPMTSANLVVINVLGRVLSATFYLSTALIFMEALRVHPKKIYPIARWLTAAAALYFCAVFFGAGFPMGLTITIKYIAAVLAIGIGAMSLLRKNRPAKLSNPYIGLAAVTSIAFLADAISKGGISHALTEVFIPFLMSIIIIYDFATAERRFIAERKTSQLLSEQVIQAKTMTTILSRFLPESLVQQITRCPEKDIQQSLTAILDPTEKRVAIIQADIRGFSHFLESNSATETSDVLRRIFEPVVDSAQHYSVVKLIGDCLFAFVEERDNENPVVKTLEIANALIASINKLYQEEPKYKSLKFGIAINYGVAIVGNLSSKSCIDYTVIGKPVNLVARLEEATKSKDIYEKIGLNGVLLGPDAVRKLPTNLFQQTQTLENIAVRSFSDVTWVGYLSADQCIVLEATAGTPIQVAA